MMRRLARWSSLLAVVISAIVMVSWIVDWDPGKRVIDTETSMKFSTALCMCMSGLTWLLFSLNKKNEWVEGGAIMFAMAQLGVMFALLLAGIYETKSPLTWFGSEDLSAKTSVAGMPSICTMFSFFSISLATVFWTVKRYEVSLILGSLCVISGVIALFGYLINEQALYCFFSDASSAMAIHTAVCFALIGVTIIWDSHAGKLDS